MIKTWHFCNECPSLTGLLFTEALNEEIELADLEESEFQDRELWVFRYLRFPIQ